MTALFATLGRFLNNMDRRAATSALVSLSLLGLIALGLLLGDRLLGLDQAVVQDAMQRLARSPFAPVGVVAVFCVLALTGFPQALLIAGTVAVFGPARGAPYCWAATMVSASLTFAIGRLFGAAFVRRLSAGRAASMIEVMRRHGALASCAVRVMPSAPFVVVNAACGAARIPLWKYWLGTGVGILPKILFLSLFTGQLDELLGFVRRRDPGDLVVMAALVIGWIVFLLFVRRLYMRLRRGALAGLVAED